jgi:ribonuclease-3
MRHKTMQENTNERLEFLGDSVIALTVTTIATNATETRTKHFTTRLRMQLVSGDTLGKLAVEIGLPSWLTLR